MEDEKTIQELYESTRCLLLSTENIGNSVKEIKNARLKNHLTEMLNTCIADLAIINGLLFEISTCENDSDIDFLINCADDDSLTDETTFPVN